MYNHFAAALAVKKRVRFGWNYVAASFFFGWPDHWSDGITNILSSLSSLMSLCSLSNGCNDTVTVSGTQGSNVTVTTVVDIPMSP